MYTNVSNDFIERLYRYSRTFRAKMIFDADGALPALTIHDDIKSIKTDGGSNPATELAIGSTPCTIADITVCGAIGADIENRDFSLMLGLLVGDDINDDDDYEYIPFGKFSVRGVSDKGGKIKIDAADFMIKTDQPYRTSLLYPNTAENILNDICTTLGLTFQSGFDFLGYTMATAPEGKTFREVIGYIAGMYGKSAIFDREGALCFKWYEVPDEEYYIDFDRTKEPEIKESSYICQYISCELADGTVISTDEGEHLSEQGMNIVNPYMTTGKLNALLSLDNLIGFSYRPSKFDMLLGDPLIDPFDILKYQKGNHTYKVVPMSLKFDFDGGLMTTLTSTKKEQTSYSSPTQRYKQNTESSIRSAMIVNRATNGQTVAIGSVEKKILTVPMSVTSNATTFILFSAQTYLTTGGTVRYIVKLNNSPVFVYKQIGVIGDHIANFMFPFQGLQAGSYTVDVCVISPDAVGSIQTMAANAIITGQGLSAAVSWNGILTLSAELTTTAMSEDSGMTVGSLTDSGSTSLLIPQTSSVSAELPSIAMSEDGGMAVSGMSSVLSLGEYPYYLGMTSDGSTKIYITLDGEISTDSTLTASLASFTIQSIVSGVSTFYTPQSVTATYDAVNSETTLEITTATAFSAAEYIDVAYNANTGTLHVGTAIEGHKVPAFSDIINFNRS